jgi:hypothetical protein
LYVMPDRPQPSDSTGPMGTQPSEHAPTAPTQMLPMMPCAKREAEEPQGLAKTPAPEKKLPTRSQAVRAALARITRRKSLRKQRDAQRG